MSSLSLPVAIAAGVSSRVAVLADQIAAKYGPTPGIGALADMLEISDAGVRARIMRVGDLPPTIPATKSHRWTSVALAEWLLGVAPDDAPVVPPEPLPAPPARRRCGRPRKMAPPAQASAE